MTKTLTIGMVSIRRKIYSPKVIENTSVLLHLVTLQLYFSTSIILEGKFCLQQNFSSLILSLINDSPPLWTTIEVTLQINILHFTHTVLSVRGSRIRITLVGNVEEKMSKPMFSWHSHSHSEWMDAYVHIPFIHFNINL